ncbi:hypothetical protein DIPPA_14252 [Diplonema papillatum]|nr:hypothetical protein DIPPA_14252 [Diplonema papillatum]
MGSTRPGENWLPDSAAPRPRASSATAGAAACRIVCAIRSIRSSEQSTETCPCGWTNTTTWQTISMNVTLRRYWMCRSSA